ncbi:MAG TPA: hypothetical protein VN765_08880, partial [Candidatus Acidoferrum sp.]|nr:hypothetical protein [Candidatus Acidoferrum sp.]
MLPLFLIFHSAFSIFHFLSAFPPSFWLASKSVSINLFRLWLSHRPFQTMAAYEPQERHSEQGWSLEDEAQGKNLGSPLRGGGEETSSPTPSQSP